MPKPRPDPAGLGRYAGGAISASAWVTKTKRTPRPDQEKGSSREGVTISPPQSTGANEDRPGSGLMVLADLLPAWPTPRVLSCGCGPLAAPVTILVEAVVPPSASLPQTLIGAARKKWGHSKKWGLVLQHHDINVNLTDQALTAAPFHARYAHMNLPVRVQRAVAISEFAYAVDGSRARPWGAEALRVCLPSFEDAAGLHGRSPTEQASLYE